MTPDLVNILKQVSRSFYLSLRILRPGMRETVSLAYLIARAADTVADSSSIAVPDRVSILISFKRLLSSGSDRLDLSELLESVDHAGEKTLLQNIDSVFDLYFSFNQKSAEQIKNVCNTLIDGMLFDMEYFSGQQRSLRTFEELDHYTYLVAGCVGEFWTVVSLSSGGKFKKCDLSALISQGVSLGKALQHTNIIRDVSSDWKLGRCYIPQEVLESQGLSIEQFFNADSLDLNEKLKQQWLIDILTLYSQGASYLRLIPFYQWRLRMSVILPLMIGLKTLLKVQHDKFPSGDRISKISRREVYSILVVSGLFVSFPVIINRYLSRNISNLRKSIEL